MLSLVAFFLFLATCLAVMNHLFFKLPASIGLMVTSLVGSLLLVLIGVVGYAAPVDFAIGLVGQVDLESLIMDGMLSFLLFAAALHVDFSALVKQRGVILALASVGVVVTTFTIGFALHYGLALVGIELGLLYCLIFGALISPTDPIAVIGILKQANAPKSLELKIAGESLFNDGTAVVLSSVLIAMAATQQEVSLGSVSGLFAKEVLGGIGLGLLLGYVAVFFMHKVDDYKIDVMLTLSLVMGGYWLCQSLHVSGPLAMVVAGLLIGNKSQYKNPTDTDIKYLDHFWEMIDELLNAVLFVFIGLEVLIVYNQGLSALSDGLVMGLVAVPVVLLARFASISAIVHSFKPFRDFSNGAISIMTWGGLRGGISIALCLSLPESPERSLLLVATYLVVVFSILVQGLTIGPLVKRTQV